MDNLMHLHEASILHNVRLRFQRDDIYTGNGSCSSSFNCVFGTGSGAQGSHAVLGCWPLFVGHFCQQRDQFSLH